MEAERYLALFSQAERMRLSLLMLRRLRIRLGREPGGEADAELVSRALKLAATLLTSIGAALTAGVKADPHLECLAELNELSAHLWEQDASDAPAPSSTVPFRHDARWQLDALAGQLRSAVELAAHTTRAGQADFDRQEAAQPWHLRLGGAFAVLRANLSHILARYLGWQRAYWAPMTVAIVLKPDYSATHSRGVLRLAGTFAGLAQATALFHLLAPAQIWQAALITAFMFLMRWSGGANYGLLVTPLTALVVFLFALGGTPPGPLMTARALNTVVGGSSPSPPIVFGPPGSGHKFRRRWPHSSMPTGNISRLCAMPTCSPASNASRNSPRVSPGRGRPAASLDLTWKPPSRASPSNLEWSRRASPRPRSSSPTRAASSTP